MRPVVGLATVHLRLSCCGIVLQRFGYGHFGNPTLRRGVLNEQTQRHVKSMTVQGILRHSKI